MRSMQFLDDWLIERRTGIERVWSQPNFVKEVFTDYFPRGMGYVPVNVFRDENLDCYVMYVRVHPQEGEPGFIVRLTSDDPREWNNPVYDSSAVPAWTGFQDVVVDERREPINGLVTPLGGTPLEERGYLITAVGKRETFVGFSEGGLQFRLDKRHPWRDIRSDTWNGVVWNERNGTYQMFTRPACADRRVTVVQTTDFLDYTPPMTILQPDGQDAMEAEIYGMPTRPYEDVFIGMPQVYTPDPLEEARIKMGGRVVPELAYSYNGINWYRPVRRPFIPVREPGLPGGAAIYGQRFIRAKDNTLLFYASGSKGEHDAYPDIREAGMDLTGYFGALLCEMRLDGFCSLRTWGRDGVLRTKTIIPRALGYLGEGMLLNVRTMDHTSVRVQILDGETAEPIRGYTFEEAVPISGDHLFAEPTWKEKQGISELMGRPVRIEIAMQEAELFAIRLKYDLFIGDTAAQYV